MVISYKNVINACISHCESQNPQTDNLDICIDFELVQNKYYNVDASKQGLNVRVSSYTDHHFR